MVDYTSMALNPLNSSNLEQLALKGLTTVLYVIMHLTLQLCVYRHIRDIKISPWCFALRRQSSGGRHRYASQLQGTTAAGTGSGPGSGTVMRSVDDVDCAADAGYDDDQTIDRNGLNE